MTKKIALLLFAVACWNAAAQSSGSSAAFEAVSIKPVPALKGSGRLTLMSDDGAQLNYQRASLLDLLKHAYGVQADQIIGPAWLDDDQYAVHAKIPDGVSKERIPEMLQAMLRDRFLIKLHRESRQLAVYSLVQAKSGSRLISGDTRTGLSSGTGPSGRHVSGTASMQQFALWLTRQLKRSVADHTGLDGLWTIQLDWGDDAGASDALGGPSIFASLERQLGLRLEEQKEPVEVLVIEHAEKLPTEN